MDSIRQQKISKVLQKEISELLQKEGKHFCAKALVTVTSTRITPDLSIAKVYLSIFGVQDKNSILENFKTSESEVRYLMGKRIKNQLRHVPEFHFYIDDSLDYIEKIDKALKN